MGRWSWFILLFSIIVPTAAVPWIAALSTQSLLLPPVVRLGFAGGAQALQKDCEARSLDGCIWDTDVLGGLVRVVNNNADRLGGVKSEVLAWPKAPCNGIQLFWPSAPLRNELTTEKPAESSNEAAVSATKTWVDDTLCRLSLCPYTASLSRAAVGLESANVKVGPIVILPPLYRPDASAASLLAAAFWEGVTDIATTPEETVATLLLIAPSDYDADFHEFAATCDDLIEVTVQVVKADQIVGRAWFHPSYSTVNVGHDKIIAGHALPASMVQGFIADNMSGSLAEHPSLQLVEKANDAVRWTPHATINLLRRSQLNAAKQVEAASSNKKPNAVYARNVMKILADKKTLPAVDMN
ncbi:hypothetical protein MHU86_22365 [Fragilaria crotonensis]|nr:hypothetical protein MHU86_22365 [Fragilaria crotonensis]